jgi:uncharacterized small protein (DUF1192 family)
MMNQEVVSFVLRFVREAGETQQARWRGTVKHVQGSAEKQFNQFSEALSFMQGQLNEAVESSLKNTAQITQANPLLETAKLWGEFVPQYNKLVLDSVNEAVAKGAELPRQINQAMAFWGGWQEAEVALEQKLDLLNKQLATLTQTVAALQEEVARLKAQPTPARKSKK